MGPSRASSSLPWGPATQGHLQVCLPPVAEVRSCAPSQMEEWEVMGVRGGRSHPAQGLPCVLPGIHTDLQSWLPSHAKDAEG